MAKKKGYRPSERSTRPRGSISFAEDHEFHGAEIDVWLTAPLKLFLDISSIPIGKSLSADEFRAEFAPVLTEFAEHCLIEWNVEDKSGVPVTADGPGLMAQDIDFILAILIAWTAEVGRVSAPLVSASNGTKPELEASMPAVSLS